MNEYFTPKAKAILQLAKAQANIHGLISLGPQHIVLAILMEDKGIARISLNLAGIDLQDVDLQDPIWQRAYSESSNFEEACMKAVESTSQKYVTPAQLLLAILDDETHENAKEFLESLGVKTDSLKATIYRFLGEEYKSIGEPFPTKPPPDPESGWFASKPAPVEVIAQLKNKSGLTLPEDYTNFLKLTNGGEGALDIMPLNFHLWPAEDVLELNEGYSVDDYIPGYFAIGSSGGGECLAFNTREDPPWKVYRIPFIPMEEKYAELVADSFSNLLEHVVPSDDNSDYMDMLGSNYEIADFK
jgi:hypothetical protein